MMMDKRILKMVIIITIGIVGPLALGDSTPNIFLVNEAYAQTTLNVTESVPCFMNYTASGLELIQNCGLGDDYLKATTIGFDWVTGGLWPLIVVTVLIVMTYIKYQNGIYPLAIGIVFLPLAGAFFPDQFISYAIVIAALVAAGSIFIMLIHRTKDY